MSTSIDLERLEPSVTNIRAFHLAGHTGFVDLVGEYIGRSHEQGAPLESLKLLGAASLVGVSRSVDPNYTDRGVKVISGQLSRIQSGSATTPEREDSFRTGVRVMLEEVDEEERGTAVEVLQRAGLVDNYSAKQLGLQTIDGLRSVRAPIDGSGGDVEELEESEPELGSEEELTDLEKKAKQKSLEMRSAKTIEQLRKAFTEHPLVRDPNLQHLYNIIIGTRIRDSINWPIADAWYEARLPGGSEQEELRIALARDYKLIDIAEIGAELGRYEDVEKLLLKNSLISPDNELIGDEDLESLTARHFELLVHSGIKNIPESKVVNT